jgi:hypothetical protein
MSSARTAIAIGYTLAPRVPRKSTVISDGAGAAQRRARAKALEGFLGAKFDDQSRPEWAVLQRDVRRIQELTLPLRQPGRDRRPIEAIDERAVDRVARGARRTAVDEAHRRIRAGQGLNRLAALLSEADVRLDFERAAPADGLPRRVIPLVPFRPTIRVTGRWSEIVFALYEQVLGSGQVFPARCGHLVARAVTVGRLPVTCGELDCERAARRERPEVGAARQRRHVTRHAARRARP